MTSSLYKGDGPVEDDGDDDASYPSALEPAAASMHEGTRSRWGMAGFLGTPMHHLRDAFRDAETALVCTCGHLDMRLRAALSEACVAKLSSSSNRETRLKALAAPDLRRRLSKLGLSKLEEAAIDDVLLAFRAAGETFACALNAISEQIRAIHPRWWPKELDVFSEQVLLMRTPTLKDDPLLLERRLMEQSPLEKQRRLLEALSRRVFRQYVHKPGPNPHWETRVRKTGFHLLHLGQTTEVGKALLQHARPRSRTERAEADTNRREKRARQKQRLAQQLNLDPFKPRDAPTAHR